MESFTETLEVVTLGNHVRIELTDGTAFEGPASPIDYMPDDRFRLEIEPREKQIRRCEVSAEYVEGEWTTPEVRHYSLGDDDWTVAGEADDIEITR
ncbi:hypothetical protein [Haladaptatus sp. NG-WS-4]